MASPLYHKPPIPPGIYRAARALRRLSAIALIFLIVFVAVVAYSAVQITKAQPRVGNSTVGFEPNDTVGISTSFSLSNPTYFAIQHFSLHFRILNGTGLLLVDSSTAPTTIAPGASASLPVELYVPLTSVGANLLTENQYLQWEVWGNASYAYLFSVSIGVDTNRSWGAPFEGLAVSAGAPAIVNGTASIPVAVSFSNDASFSDSGTLDFQVVSSSGVTCSQGGFALNVPGGRSYQSTQNIAVAAGCNPAGGHVKEQFAGFGFTVPLPSEPIP